MATGACFENSTSPSTTTSKIPLLPVISVTSVITCATGSPASAAQASGGMPPALTITQVFDSVAASPGAQSHTIN